MAIYADIIRINSRPQKPLQKPCKSDWLLFPELWDKSNFLSFFYQELTDGQADVAIYPLDAPLRQVRNREELVILFRMPLLNPLSKTSCATDKLDAFIANELDSGLANSVVINTSQTRVDYYLHIKNNTRR